MTLIAEPAHLRVWHARADTREHVWLERLLVAQITDLSRREALARAAKQETISLALTAQCACLVRLRELTNARYWSLLNGTAVPVE
jgi:hypothetical protein